MLGLSDLIHAPSNHKIPPGISILTCGITFNVAGAKVWGKIHLYVVNQLKNFLYFLILKIAVQFIHLLLKTLKSQKNGKISLAFKSEKII